MNAEVVLPRILCLLQPRYTSKRKSVFPQKAEGRIWTGAEHGKRSAFKVTRGEQALGKHKLLYWILGDVHEDRIMWSDPELTCLSVKVIESITM